MKILIDFIKSKQRLMFEDIFIPIISYPIFYIFYYNFISTDVFNKRVSNYSFSLFAILLIIIRFIRFKKNYKNYNE